MGSSSGGKINASSLSLLLCESSASQKENLDVEEN